MSGVSSKTGSTPLSPLSRRLSVEDVIQTPLDTSRERSLSRSRLSSTASKVLKSPVVQETVKKMADTPTSGSSLRSFNLSDVHVPGLTTALANTPLAPAALSGAVKPTTQVSTSPVRAVLADSVKRAAVSSVTTASDKSSDKVITFSPEVAKLVKELQIAQPVKSPPSPKRSPNAFSTKGMSVKTATQIIEGIGLTPLRTILTLDGDEMYARYILAAGDMNALRTGSCSSMLRNVETAGLPTCLPYTVLIALDQPNAVEPNKGRVVEYAVSGKSITRISSAPSVSQDIIRGSPTITRILLDTPSLSGVCSISRDFSKIQTAHRAGSLAKDSPFVDEELDKGDIEFGTLLLVEDGERNGAQSGISMSEDMKHFSSAGIAPIIPLSRIITNPESAIKEIVETTEITRKRMQEIERLEFETSSDVIEQLAKQIKDSLCDKNKGVLAAISKYSKLSEETQRLYDAALCKLHNYRHSYEDIFAKSDEIPESEGEKYSKVIANINAYTNQRNDLLEISERFRSVLANYSYKLDHILHLINRDLGGMHNQLLELTDVLKLHTESVGNDFTSTGKENE